MKTLFNFYLDEEKKYEAMTKLVRLIGSEQKGQLASLLRAFIDTFLETPDGDVDKTLLMRCKENYILSTTSNKRSKM